MRSIFELYDTIAVLGIHVVLILVIVEAPTVSQRSFGVQRYMNQHMRTACVHICLPMQCSILFHLGKVSVRSTGFRLPVDLEPPVKFEVLSVCVGLHMATGGHQAEHQKPLSP